MTLRERVPEAVKDGDLDAAPEALGVAAAVCVRDAAGDALCVGNAVGERLARGVAELDRVTAASVAVAAAERDGDSEMLFWESLLRQSSGSGTGDTVVAVVATISGSPKALPPAHPRFPHRLILERDRVARTQVQHLVGERRDKCRDASHHQFAFLHR